MTATQSPAADTQSLARELSLSLRGEVRFSAGSRALYANDGSVHRQLPLGVVIPRDTNDVIAGVEVCRRHGAPIGARGCGTGLAGQTVNEAVMFDFSKYMNKIIELDPERRLARVQPGVVLDWLRDAAEEHALTFGPDPATHSRCTLGGMIGNNSCGTHSIIAGVTADNIEALDVLLYDGTRLTLPSAVSDEELERTIAAGGRRGEIYRRLRELAEHFAGLVRERYPQIPRRISGYNLDRLLPERGFNLAAAFVGTEATCGLVLEAVCRLIQSPQYRALLVLGYEDTPTAADQVPEIMDFGPIGLETFDRQLIVNELKKGFKRKPELMPPGDAWLLVEFGGDSHEEADERGRRLLDALDGRGQKPHVGARLYSPGAWEIPHIWQIREGGCTHSKVPGEHPGWAGWEDAAVAPEKTGDYLREFQRVVDAHGLRVASYFGHVGHGCLHTRLDFDFSTAEGVRTYRHFMEAAADLVVRYGGSLSGEHGDGHSRAELLPKMFGPELVGAFREFKAIWDPDFKMNPGKVVDPYPLDTHLRMDPSYTTRAVKTLFSYPADNGSFTNAAERCFGVGACRSQDGVMCPSYQVTLEEAHSTRGRARLLFEMMRNDSPLDGAWRNEEVKDSLDLCLACKACVNECPVRVDMASYKAEFLSHYYKGRIRPRQAYVLGLIRWEAELAARAPRLANLLTQRQPFAGLGKRLAGVAPERRLPAFAQRTFKQWFSERPAPNGATRPKVLLWPDTFSDHFHPHVAVAATEVLEAAGFRVVVPERPLCCGRPLYDYGMLRLARRLLRRTLDALREEIHAGTPVVALEPSCGAVFRDELVNMLPGDEDARRLARQTFSLGELLAKHADRWDMPRLESKALVHFHCHQRATSDTDCDRAVLDRLGLDYEVLDDGCCGLAGSFGYERGERYEVSVKAAERVLLPAVRSASEHTLLMTDGFSCRCQIEHGSERSALHLAEVLQMALHDGPAGPAVGPPERIRETQRL